MAAKLPPGYALERERVTSIPARWNGRITHPILSRLTAPDGSERYFDTTREALEYLSDPDNVIAPESGNVAQSA